MSHHFQQSSDSSRYHGLFPRLSLQSGGLETYLTKQSWKLRQCPMGGVCRLCEFVVKLRLCSAARSTPDCSVQIQLLGSWCIGCVCGVGSVQSMHFPVRCRVACVGVVQVLENGLTVNPQTLKIMQRFQLGNQSSGCFSVFTVPEGCMGLCLDALLHPCCSAWKILELACCSLNSSKIFFLLAKLTDKSCLCAVQSRLRRGKLPGASNTELPRHP